jgi:exodeoxyribonuclease V alpha subunit
MSIQRNHAPLDTAWSRFESEDLKRTPSRYVELLRELERRALFFHLDPYMVSLAAELATFSPHLSDEEQAALTLLTLSTLVDLSRGSTRTPADGPKAYQHLRQIYTHLYPDAAPALLTITRRFLDQGGALEVLGQDEEDYTPLLYIDGYLYHQKIYAIEKQLAQLLAIKLARKQSVSISKIQSIQDDLRAHPARLAQGQIIHLSQEQEQALYCAMSSQLAFISGGPGTGKTSIVVALLRALLRLGIAQNTIALAAPTGKAAWRMGESIRKGLAYIEQPSVLDQALKTNAPIPQTLHRLLGYHPITQRFKHHHNFPLDCKVVIVDESSMIDIFLMERLLAALPPDAQLILLGDADQLPSVSAGAVFRDLLSLSADTRATLTQSYRMRSDNPNGLAILSVAQEVKAGQSLWHNKHGLQSTWIKKREDISSLQGAGVELLTLSVAEQWKFLDHWAHKYIMGNDRVNELRRQTWTLEQGKIIAEEVGLLTPLFEHLSQSRVLCLTQNLDTGVAKINARFHGRYARKMQQDFPFLVGEPVMMLHNDYDRMLFNGDQGIILWIVNQNQRKPMVVFPELGGGFKAYEMEALTGRIEHCYAMTVHKSQGSEFDRIALVLPIQRIPLLSKELLYTAITRSRHSVTLLGDPDLLTIEALNHTPRSSGLIQRIQDLID